MREESQFPTDYEMAYAFSVLNAFHNVRYVVIDQSMEIDRGFPGDQDIADAFDVFVRYYFGKCIIKGEAKTEEEEWIKGEFKFPSEQEMEQAQTILDIYESPQYQRMAGVGNIFNRYRRVKYILKGESITQEERCIKEGFDFPNEYEMATAFDTLEAHHKAIDASF